MGWIQRANQWFARPFRTPDDDAGDPEEAPAATDHQGPAPSGRAPQLAGETAQAVRQLLAPTSVQPPPAATASVDEQEVARVALLVTRHFGAHRPEPASFPALASQVMELAERVDADLARLVQLIEKDPAISSKALRVANSAAYHRGSEIATVKDAIGHLGMFAVANIAVGVACRSLYDPDAHAEFELYPRHWRDQFLQSMTVGFAASRLSVERRVDRPDHLFLAGMFHDIGKALALRSLCRLVLDGEIARCQEPVVDRVLELTHLAIAVDAQAVWRLPRYLRYLSAHHHDDDVQPGPQAAALHLLRVVSGLNAIRLGGSTDRALARQIRGSVAALGLTAVELRALTTQIRESNERTVEMFGLGR